MIKLRAYLPVELEEDCPTYRMCYDLAYEEYAPVNDLIESTENLMRFVGLHDNTGKEIYEGDIIKFYKNSNFTEDKKYRRRVVTGAVVFGDECLGFGFETTTRGNKKMPIFSLQYVRNRKSLKVIGNVFEHNNVLGKDRVDKVIKHINFGGEYK